MEYALVKIDNSDTSIDIIVEDGGICSIHHNGTHLITTYYQDRTNRIDDDMWDNLANGKAYLKDWEDKQDVDDEVIEDALDWLCPFAKEFKQVDVDTIKSKIND